MSTGRSGVPVSMPTIEVLTERAEAVSPRTLGSEVFARFESEPDTLVMLSSTAIARSAWSNATPSC